MRVHPSDSLSLQSGKSPLQRSSPAGWSRAGPLCKSHRAISERPVTPRVESTKPHSLSKVVRQPWGSALLKRAELLFGTWSAALIAAGIDLPAGTFSPWPKANKPDILEEIRRRKRKGKTLHFKSIEMERWGKPLLRRAKALFGSWDLA